MGINKIYYQAYKLKDPKFDGIFFIGVVSTGIFCRPVCTAKLPKQKNCRFFLTAAVAQEKGFRPCRRCRPELAPGFSTVDMTAHLAQSAKTLIENGAVDNLTLEKLAQRLGITSRHLRRIFTAQFGISLIKFVQSRHLLLAEQLLKETNSTITHVALKAGFGSLRQFNALFKSNFHTSPSQFRREHGFKNDI